MLNATFSSIVLLNGHSVEKNWSDWGEPPTFDRKFLYLENLNLKKSNLALVLSSELGKNHSVIDYIH